MTDHDAILAAVLDRPEDDTPRLVLADWHDDNGEPDRAAYIRASIECDRIADGDPRKREAWAAERAAMWPGKRWWTWYGPGDRINVLRWRRGFVDELATDAATWLECGAAIVKAHPVRKVALTTVPNPQCRHVGNVVRVSLMGDDGRAFVERYTVPSVLDEGWWRQTAAFLLPLCWPRITFTLPPPARTRTPERARWDGSASWNIEITTSRRWPGVDWEPTEGRLYGITDSPPPRPGDEVGPLTAIHQRTGGRYRVPRAVVTEVEFSAVHRGVTVQARTLGEFAAVPDVPV